MLVRGLVSVIIPAYNVARYIEQAVESALSQSYPAVEVLVIDDASTDATKDRITSMAHPRLRVFHNMVNRGPGAARNLGIANARGEWIALLDGDDWWDSRRLEVLMDTAHKYRADLVADNLWLIVDGQSRPWDTYFSDAGYHVRTVEKVTLASLCVMDYGLLQPLIRTEFLLEHGIRYHPRIRWGEDFVFLLDCLQHEPLMVVLPQAYYFYRNRQGSLIANLSTALPQIREGVLRWTDPVNASALKEHALLQQVIRARYRAIEDTVIVETVKGLVRQGQYQKIWRLIQSEPQTRQILRRWLPTALRRRVRKGWAALSGRWSESGMGDGRRS